MRMQRNDELWSRRTIGKCTLVGMEGDTSQLPLCNRQVRRQVGKVWWVKSTARCGEEMEEDDGKTKTKNNRSKAPVGRVVRGCLPARVSLKKVEPQALTVLGRAMRRYTLSYGYPVVAFVLPDLTTNLPTLPVLQMQESTQTHMYAHTYIHPTLLVLTYVDLSSNNHFTSYYLSQQPNRRRGRAGGEATPSRV